MCVRQLTRRCKRGNDIGTIHCSCFYKDCNVRPFFCKGGFRIFLSFQLRVPMVLASEGSYLGEWPFNGDVRFYNVKW